MPSLTVGFLSQFQIAQNAMKVSKVLILKPHEKSYEKKIHYMQGSLNEHKQYYQNTAYSKQLEY